MRLARLLAVAALAVAAGGCASEVKRDDPGGPAARLADPRVGAIAVDLSGGAAAKYANGERGSFSPSGLRTSLEFHLTNRRVYAEGAPQRLVVDVTDYRLRSRTNAVLFGFLAGADRLEGTVTVLAADGSRLEKFEVSASYALGGGLGEDGARLGWLYSEFARRTADGLLGAGK